MLWEITFIHRLTSSTRWITLPPDCMTSIPHNYIFSIWKTHVDKATKMEKMKVLVMVLSAVIGIILYRDHNPFNNKGLVIYHLLLHPVLNLFWSFLLYALNNTVLWKPFSFLISVKDLDLLQQKSPETNTDESVLTKIKNGLHSIKVIFLLT